MQVAVVPQPAADEKAHVDEETLSRLVAAAIPRHGLTPGESKELLQALCRYSPSDRPPLRPLWASGGQFSRTMVGGSLAVGAWMLLCVLELARGAEAAFLGLCLGVLCVALALYAALCVHVRIGPTTVAPRAAKPLLGDQEHGVRLLLCLHLVLILGNITWLALYARSQEESRLNWGLSSLYTFCSLGAVEFHRHRTTRRLELMADSLVGVAVGAAAGLRAPSCEASGGGAPTTISASPPPAARSAGARSSRGRWRPVFSDPNFGEGAVAKEKNFFRTNSVQTHATQPAEATATQDAGPQEAQPTETEEPSLYRVVVREPEARTASKASKESKLSSKEDEDPASSKLEIVRNNSGKSEKSGFSDISESEAALVPVQGELKDPGCVPSEVKSEADEEASPIGDLLCEANGQFAEKSPFYAASNDGSGDTRTASKTSGGAFSDVSKKRE